MTRSTLGLGLLFVTLAACHHARVPAPPGRTSSPRPAATAPDDPPPPEVARNPFYEEDRPDTGGELPDTDVDAAIQAVVDEAPSRASVPGVAAKPWDKKSPPEYLDRVVEHLGLTARERALLVQNGFVASARHTYASYGVALHDIHQQELPLYLSADAVMQGLFRSHEDIMIQGEMALEPRIGVVLSKMHAALVGASSGYDAAVAGDADLYLTVAERLLKDESTSTSTVLGDPSTSTDADALVAKATAAEGIAREHLFGRDRLVDWTFYTPRGPYAGALPRYFRAMVWLTRMEMNLVSRGGQSSAPVLDPTETPREATLALVLADLAKRAGVAGEIATIDKTYRVLAGPREDVPLAALATLGKGTTLSDPDKASATLRAAIGESYPRTINFHVRPYVTAKLPAIATFFGVGITPDANAVTALSPKGNPRVVRASEVAYVLGNERARAFAGPAFPGEAAEKAKRDLSTARRGPDLYASWLGAIRGFSEPIPSTSPSFMKTTAFADARVGSTVNAYAQIRHAYVLHAAQVYDEGGCVIPDAWVEPAVGVYDQILGYAKTLEGANDVLPDAAAYAKKLTLIVGALRAISVDELAGRPISEKQRAFLRMVAEYVRATGYVRSQPRLNGWYPKLFTSKRAAFDRVAFVGDFFTTVDKGRIAYAGAREPRLGVFIVDVAGTPRAMVGPIASAIELDAPIKKRLDDDAWSLFKETPMQPWERSYVGDDPHAPNVSLSAADGMHVSAPKGYRGEIIVETVDEHYATIARATMRLSKPGEELPVALTPVDGRAADTFGLRLRLPSGEAWTVKGDFGNWSNGSD